MAIDFETANADRGSICAVGIAVVSHGEIIKHFRSLVRPYDLRFDPYNISIHGITPDDVKAEPDIRELWPAISKYFEGPPVIAHNASFDISALRHALDHFHMDYPTLDYACTRLISQRVWPGLVSYSLSLIARYLAIEFDHHDPSEDAKACAEIARRACQHLGVSDLKDLTTRSGAGLGHLWPGGYDSPNCKRPPRREDPPTPVGEPDPQHPLYGKTVVFTGTLQSMTRKEAWSYVAGIGGSYLDSMNSSVDFLVVGDLDFRTFQSGNTKSIKIRRAEDMLAKGRSIEIMSEDDFLRLL